MSNSKAILPSLLLIFLSACSESTIEFENLVERGDVYYKQFSTEPFSGRVTGLRAGKLVNGRFEGEVFEFRSDGQLRNETSYSRGLRHGIQRLFTDEGKLARVNEFKNGELVAFKYFYDDAESTVKSSTRIEDGIHYTSYFHQNGALAFEIPVKGYFTARDPIMSSSVIEFDSDGQQVVEYPLSNNKIHGPVRWTAGDFAGCEYEFTNGIVYLSGYENRRGKFIPEDEVEQRITEMEEFYSEPCFEAVRRIPCPLCYLNNHSDKSG